MFALIRTAKTTSGNLTSPPKYDVYGNVRSNGGTASTKHGFVGSLGLLSEAETGLIYMRARYMDPAVGRFISQDPSRDGANWFVYCSNNPVNAVDRNGKDPSAIAIGEFLTGFTTLWYAILFRCLGWLGDQIYLPCVIGGFGLIMAAIDTTYDGSLAKLATDFMIPLIAYFTANKIKLGAGSIAEIAVTGAEIEVATIEVYSETIGIEDE